MKLELSSQVGELGMWIGMFCLVAFSGALPVSAAVATAASLLLTYVLLRHVSGDPPLEARCRNIVGRR
jgi:steroid 5-alpha reductase family enzyme